MMWRDSKMVIFADNDVKGGDPKDIVAKVYDKQTKTWHGYRSVNFSKILKMCFEFAAPRVTRYARQTKNKTDLANQRLEGVAIDTRTKRKNARVNLHFVVKHMHLRSLGSSLMSIYFTMHT